MEIGRHLNDRDLKLVPPPELDAEQLAEWNAAYGPENDAMQKAGLSGAALLRWKYQRYLKDYLRCVAALDDEIGRVLEAKGVVDSARFFSLNATVTGRRDELKPGDYVHIPAHARHRVAWTDAAQPTVWLAVHYV